MTLFFVQSNCTKFHTKNTFRVETQQWMDTTYLMFIPSTNFIWRTIRRIWPRV